MACTQFRTSVTYSSRLCVDCGELPNEHLIPEASRGVNAVALDLLQAAKDMMLSSENHAALGIMHKLEDVLTSAPQAQPVPAGDAGALWTMIENFADAKANLATADTCGRSDLAHSRCDAAERKLRAALDTHPQPAQASTQVPVAEINRAGSLVWANGAEPLQSFMGRHPNLKIGTKLYASPVTPEGST